MTAHAPNGRRVAVAEALQVAGLQAGVGMRRCGCARRMQAGVDAHVGYKQVWACAGVDAHVGCKQVWACAGVDAHVGCKQVWAGAGVTAIRTTPWRTNDNAGRSAARCGADGRGMDGRG
eukprot:364516-Chlamydomonas_euryale.AAC.25